MTLLTPVRRIRTVHLAWMYPLAALLTAWQVWSALRNTNSFLLSYWFVTWDHGFIRRGLLGEINQLFFGESMLQGAEVLSRVVAALSAGTVVLVAALLLWRRTALAVGLAWLLLVSPFTVEGLINFSRPDQLAIPLLLLVGVVWWRWPHRPLIPLAVIGVGFAVVILAHEAVVLMYAPWILVLIVHFSRHARWQVLATRVAVVFAVPVLFTLAILDRGTATKKQVKLLRADVKGEMPKGNNILNYLDDSTADSVRKVLHFQTLDLFVMVLVGLALWAVHLLALRLVPGVPRRPSRPVAAALLLTVLPAFLIQSLLAFDWQRWFALWLAMGLLTYGIVLVFSPQPSPWRPTPQVTGEDKSWTRPRVAAFVALCVLLTLVPISTANNKLPCSVDYLVREAPYPFQRVGDVVTGDHHKYRYPKCKHKN